MTAYRRDGNRGGFTLLSKNERLWLISWQHSNIVDGTDLTWKKNTQQHCDKLCSQFQRKQEKTDALVHRREQWLLCIELLSVIKAFTEPSQPSHMALLNKEDKNTSVRYLLYSDSNFATTSSFASFFSNFVLHMCFTHFLDLTLPKTRLISLFD